MMGQWEENGYRVLLHIDSFLGCTWTHLEMESEL